MILCTIYQDIYQEGKNLETLVQTIRIYCFDIGMEFGMEKYARLKMKKEEKETIEGIERPSLGSIQILGEKENCKYHIYQPLRSGRI